MSFFETEFPRIISFKAMGGPEFFTTVKEAFSGFEQRNQNWSTSRSNWAVSLMTPSGQFINNYREFLDALQAFFLCVGGKQDGFRFYDHTDFDNGTSATFQGLGDSNTQTFQLVKNYSAGARTYVRNIVKPITSNVDDYLGDALTDTVDIYVGGTKYMHLPGYAAGSGAQYTLDYTTGLFTFATEVGTLSLTAVSMTGSTATYSWTLVSGAAPTAGMRIPITGMSDAGNNGTFYIIAASGATSGTFTVSNPSGVNASTQTGSGVTDWTPKLNAVITATFQFHYPVRFDTDKFSKQVEESDVASGNTIISWTSVGLQELRMESGSQG
jgi:uncharacterized protein (TIGR02217 family)